MKIVKILVIVAAATFFVSRCHADGVASFTAVKEVDGYSVYFSNNIQQSDFYTNLYILMIQNQPENVYLYLSGYGGRIDAIQDILNIKKRFNIKFHAKVYGSVYSAHALLALNSDTIEAYNDKTFFMLHRPAIGNKLPINNCEKFWFWEKDRGQPKIDKCMKRVLNEERIFNSIVLPNIYKYMTKSEIKDYEKGKDIYITWETLKKRISAK